MALKIGDALLKMGVDMGDLEQGLRKADREVKDTMKRMESSFRSAGVALTAIGAATVKMTAEAKAMNAQLGQTALSLNVSTGEMRDLALASTNVTFPLESVQKTFDLLARAGVKNAGDLQASAHAFDALADATGSSAETLAGQLIPSFKLFGMELPKTAAEMDRFTWLTRHTMVDVSDFAQAMNYVAREGQGLNISVDDIVAALAALESKGVTGTAATMKFRTAVTQAKNENVSLAEALGLTTTEIDKQKVAMSLATGITERNAAELKKQYGVMDKLKQKLVELTLQMGSVLEPLEGLGAAMAALGPLFIFLSTSMGRATVQAVAHTATLVANKVAALAFAAANGILAASLKGVGAAIAGSGLATMAKYAAGMAAITAQIYTAKWGIDKLMDAILGTSTAADNPLEKLKQDIDIVGKTLFESKQAHDANTNAITNEEAAYLALGSAIHQTFNRIGEVKKAEQMSASEMLDNIQELTRKAKEAARTRADYEIKQLEKALDAASQAHGERLDFLRVEYDETIKAIDAQFAATVSGYSAQMAAIDAKLNTISAARKQRENEARKTALETQLAATRDFTTRLELMGQINDLVAQSGNAPWQAQRKAELEEELAAEQGATRRKLLEDLLSRFLVDSTEYTTEAQLEAQKRSLQDEIAAAREAAQHKKDLARESYEYAVNRLNAEYEAFKATKQLEKTALQENLQAQLTAYDDELDKFKTMLKDKNTETARFVEEHNKLMAALTKDITLTVTTVNRTVNEGGGGLPPGYMGPELGGGSSPSHPGIWATMAAGGIVKSPTMLSNLAGPWGVMAEKGPEAIVPLDRMGYRTANIVMELDGRVLGRLLGKVLVDEIRVKTGMRC